ncbi:MAG TPA: DUF3107 domain-containing protein [Dermatophilaceae bacterium]|nr:DUF3107 domain-containing protein [Dermatophilaceae bacterium]
MEVTIGVQNVAREISLETDESPADVQAAVQRALEDGGVLRLSDERGRQILVPGRALGWVQIGESDKRGVGFGG